MEYDYQSSALSLLLYQFENSTNVKGLLTSLLEPTKEFQSGLNQLLVGYKIFGEEDELAVGEQIDKIGKLLNVPRLGMSDSDYIGAIRAQIIINRATGSAGNFIELLQLVLPESVRFRLIESFPAAVQVVMYSPQNVINASIVKALLPIGVEGLFLGNPYEDKVLWAVQNIADSPQADAILPNVADVSTSDVVIANVVYTT